MMYNMPSLKCPVCDRVLDAATSLGERALPRDGDITLCLYCQTVCLFTMVNGEITGLREPTDSELVVIINDHPEILRFIRAAGEWAYRRKQKDASTHQG